MHKAIYGTKEFCRNLQTDAKSSNNRCARGSWRANTGNVSSEAMKFLKSNKKERPWTHIGTGVHLDRPETIVDLNFPDHFRKGHFWCCGTTRVGKPYF